MRKSKMLKLDRQMRPWLKYYGNIPANLEYPDYSMVDMIIDAAQKYPDNIAYTYYGSKVTFKEFVQRIKRTGNCSGRKKAYVKRAKEQFRHVT